GAVVGDLDAAQFAATADLDLRLDRTRVPDPLGGGDRVLDGAGGLPVGHGDAVTREQLLALVLEEIHPRLACSRSSRTLVRPPGKAWKRGAVSPWHHGPRHGDPKGHHVRHF